MHKAMGDLTVYVDVDGAVVVKQEDDEVIVHPDQVETLKKWLDEAYNYAKDKGKA